MSDEGEKTCPLCAEEMDMTDQQLRPCKCGYQVCVWCWHHIMEMAEKDETEGRCPACRTPYNKEKVVGMAANCERLVSETSMEKKLKSQKGKGKTSEGRKQLASVRVVQRNLVYVVGLPLNFADEDQLLQRKEYFGQYGKVLKVSISRTAAGSVQQFANSTCSVYITYAKEEEAVRCIQSVHGFTLDGRPLRACFGTTKYCHAWLRNMPCSNPDCLYLHENGSQEDSFTKDEIISAYTRVQNITGTSNNMQRRSGNVLPPPADEYGSISSASSGKPIAKTATNTNISTVSARVSPPNSSPGRSAALPAGASWGTRPSSNQPMPVSTPFPNGPLKHKPDISIGPVALSTAVASPSQALSFNIDTGKKSIPKDENPVSLDKGKTETLVSTEKESSPDGGTAVPDSSFASARPVTLSINRQHHTSPTSLPPPTTIRTADSSVTSSAAALDTDSDDSRTGNMDKICSDVKSMSIHENQQLQNGYVDHSGEQLTSHTSANGANTNEELYLTEVQSDIGLGMPTRLQPANLHEVEDDLLSFDKQRIKDPEVSTNRISDFSHAFPLSKHSFRSPPVYNAGGLVSGNPDRQVIDRNSNSIISTSNFPGGHHENTFTGAAVNDVGYSNLFPSKEKRTLLGRYDNAVASGAGDMGESSIISNILSMDFDSWDEPLTSPQHLSKLLTDKQGSFGVPSSRKIQNSNQSRFSFAREDEPMSHMSGSGQSVDFSDQAFKQRPFGHDFSSSNSLHFEKFVAHSDFPVFNSTESDPFASSHSSIASNKISAVSRSQISAPPGFSVPSRAPPPGFTSHERTEQNLANHMFGASSFIRNQQQSPSIGNTYNHDDIEFMDPAILAVGKGTLPTSVNSSGLDIRSSFSPQLSTYGEGRFESFLQRSLPPQQNQRYVDTGDSFSHVDDAYRLPSRVMEQTVANNFSPLSQFTLSQSRNGVTPNGQWDGWNEMHSGGNLGMAELFRNERLPFNKFYGGYEDPKIRMPNSGNLYNGTYGI